MHPIGAKKKLPREKNGFQSHMILLMIFLLNQMQKLKLPWSIIKRA